VFSIVERNILTADSVAADSEWNVPHCDEMQKEIGFAVSKMERRRLQACEEGLLLPGEFDDATEQDAKDLRKRALAGERGAGLS
jgi:hypothetical protein